jgi:uncharacterized protein (DUF305 family)
MSPRIFTALILGISLCAATAQGADNQSSEGSNDLHQSMMTGMEKMHSMKMSGNTDADFASMMIEHHRQAIAMSRAELEHGSNAELKAKARQIIADSEKDIGDLEKVRQQNPQ